MPHNRWEGNLRPIELMKMTYLMLSERERVKTERHSVISARMKRQGINKRAAAWMQETRRAHCTVQTGA